MGLADPLCTEGLQYAVGGIKCNLLRLPHVGCDPLHGNFIGLLYVQGRYLPFKSEIIREKLYINLLLSSIKGFYFSKNYAKIKYISVDYSTHFSGVTTASDASESQKTELKELAQDYLARLEKGENIDELIEQEEKASAAEEKEEEKEEEEEEHDHEHDYTFVQKDTSDDPSDFNKKVFAAKIGEPALIENSTYGYYVLIRYKTDADSEDYFDRDTEVLSSMKADAFADIIEKEIKKIKVNENSAAIKRYKPQNVTLG